MNALPIDAALPPLREALSRADNVVLEAPPGAGKTTRVPLALLDAPWLAGQTILMLEPRRLAARAAAERLASERGEQVGETVGYRIRLDSRVGPTTRIEVVTEGILTRRLQDDPALEGVGLVIFDEFHERNLDADLALALTLNGRALLRDGLPLKVLVMSATLEGERLSMLLDDAPVVRSEGRAYPVEVRWGRRLLPGDRVEPRVVDTILQALDEETGSVLVFLPGQAEIRRVQQALEGALGNVSNTRVCPLHGDLDLQTQRAAIEPAPDGIRKVVLATNIAETSLTIEGIRVVVDAGLARVPRFDPGSGMTRLDTQRISRASATQRAGRAGRLEPGVCYRLWSEEQHEGLPAHGAPEILQADLCGLALQLARWGVEADELSWLDQPPGAAMAQARDLLTRLGALDGGRITSHGQAMAGLAAHPRLAHMLLKARAFGLDALGCDIAALLSERDILRGGCADLHRRLDYVGGERDGAAANRGAVQRIRQMARQFRGSLRGAAGKPIGEMHDTRWPGLLLALAYPDRIAQQRRPGGAEYRLSNGRAALFAESDGLMKHEWLVIAGLGSRHGHREELIHLAAPLDVALFETLLAEQVTRMDELDWDEREGVMRAERQRRIGALILAREPLDTIDEQARTGALLRFVRRKGLNLLPWTPAIRQWQARIAFLRSLDLDAGKPSEWPDLSDEALLNDLEDWLAPYLNGVRRMSHFAGLDLGAILQGTLPWPLPTRLDALAPVSIDVPSGSRIRIDYSESPPVLAVRLQELFGLPDTPRIAEGRVPLKLHLLSPAQRPVQVTQDLASFWASTYAEVKKDLKGRYPKHYWPDDPLIAEPTSRAKPRR
ncbi:ATP-dependent helicase HrpB [Pseudomonas sp. Marseille-QA0892]